MKHGMQVGLRPAHIVLDGDPAPHKTDTASPNFRPVYCGQTAGFIRIPLGMEVGLSPVDVLDGNPAPPPRKGAQPPNFRPMFAMSTKGMHDSKRTFRAQTVNNCCFAGLC